MSAADARLSAGRPAPRDPPSDRRRAAVPERIAAFHPIVVILSEYGRHLYATLPQRAALRGFATLAQFFGTATVNTILAQLYRGIMRCHALDRLLRDRAARGLDLRPSASRRQPAAADAPASQPAPPPPPQTEAERQAAMIATMAASISRKTAALARRFGVRHPLDFDTLPSMAQIEAEVRRSPIGRSLVLICRDFGVAPALCDGSFWNHTFHAIRCYGGSLAQLMRELRCRERQFTERELDRNPELEWPEQTREAIRRVLGFLLGERIVDPTRAAPEPVPKPAAAMAAALPRALLVAAATGPP